MIRILVTLGVALSAVAGADAHHSFPAYYFEDQSVTIEGKVIEFDFRAPHTWLHVLAPDGDGQMQALLGRVGQPSAARARRRDCRSNQTGRCPRPRHRQPWPDPVGMEDSPEAH